MALIMYLTRAPRYKNIITDEYETIPRKDIALIESYYNWGRAREEGVYSCDTLEEWCGISEKELPHKYIVNYYGDFFERRAWYSEIAGEIEKYTIFEQLARLVKMNQIFNWFIKNVMNNNVNQNYYEVTKDNFKKLLKTLNDVKDNFNENIAKDLLPVMDERGYFFGTDKYDDIYIKQVIEVIDVVNNILETTDFEKEIVYLNSIW